VIAGFVEGALPAYAHYLTPTQATLWHKLAESFRTRASGDQAFDAIFHKLTAQLAQQKMPQVELIGIGAANARKESRLAFELEQAKISTSLTLIDISSDLIAEAHLAFSKANPNTKVRTAHVADITASELEDLREAIGRELSPQTRGLKARERQARGPKARRIATLFGVLPALDSLDLFDFVVSLLRPHDFFVFSANLLPPNRSIAEVAEFYDSPLAKDWLQQILREVGLDPARMKWQTTTTDSFQPTTSAPTTGTPTTGTALNGARVHATHTVRAVITPPAGVRAEWGTATAELPAARTIEIFRSHRHSSESINQLVSELGLEMIDWQVSPSGEEGVALTRVRA